MSTLYFDVKHATIIHAVIIKISGGREGIHNLGLLESVVVHVKNDDYYPTLADKLTHIVFSIAKNHAFTDGNKRSSIALGGLFLALNGYENLVPKFFLEMENVVLWVAKNKVSKTTLAEIMNSLIDTGELSEKLKLELLAILE